MEILIRKATLADVDAITAVEAECFPEAEAAKREDFEKRLKAYGDRFWLLFADGELVSFVDGPLTAESELRDEMFADTSFHRADGEWQMIFGVCTLPQYRKKGFAARLLRTAIEESRAEGRKGVVLTCKDALLSFYASLGFVSEGESESTHGGASWNQMRIVF